MLHLNETAKSINLAVYGGKSDEQGTSLSKVLAGVLASNLQFIGDVMFGGTNVGSMKTMPETLAEIVGTEEAQNHLLGVTLSEALVGDLFAKKLGSFSPHARIDTSSTSLAQRLDVFSLADVHIVQTGGEGTLTEAIYAMMAIKIEEMCGVVDVKDIIILDPELKIPKLLKEFYWSGTGTYAGLANNVFVLDTEDYAMLQLGALIKLRHMKKNRKDGLEDWLAPMGKEAEFFNNQSFISGRTDAFPRPLRLNEWIQKN